MMMGLCLALFVLAWGVVRLWSVPVAVGMCLVAMVIPPLAAIVANRREPDEGWWDVPDDSWLEDEPEDDSWRLAGREWLERNAREAGRAPEPDDVGGDDGGTGQDNGRPGPGGHHDGDGDLGGTGGDEGTR